MLNNSHTFREQIYIPKLPQNTDELTQLSVFEMHKASIIDNALCFNHPNHFDEALEAGFFLLKIPEEINLNSIDQMTSLFFREKDGGSYDIYKGYKHITVPEDYQGYFDRSHDQWENLYLEKGNWGEFLPPDVIKTSHQMSDLGICILK